MRPYLYAIMPMKADSVFQHKRSIVIRVAKECHVDAHFPFEVPANNNDDMLDDLKHASVVFADLSYERPSCYYELGLAQALGLTTYLVACEGTTIHQIEGQVHLYRDLVSYEKLVKEAFNEAIPNFWLA